MSLRKQTKFIVIHCSATRPEMDIGAAEIRRWHINRGFADIGYHFVIRRDGTIEKGRAVSEIGAHALGYNSVSVGVCLVGGTDINGTPVNNFTARQMSTLCYLLENVLLRDYPGAEVLGHRDLSPDVNHDGVIDSRDWMKACPCFDVRSWWSSITSPEVTGSSG